MKTVIELRQERAQKIARMAELNDTGGEERDMTEAELTEYDSLKAEVQKLAERIARLEETEALTDEVQARMGRRNSELAGFLHKGIERMAGAPAYNKTRLGDNEDRAMLNYMRTGDPSGLAELRASNATDMNIGTPADGGYAVPTGHYNQIVARRDEELLSGKLGVTRITGQGTTVNVPVDNEADGEFVVTSEAGDFDLDSPAIGQVQLTLAAYTKYFPISYQLLEDEDSNLLSFIANWIGRGMARTHNSLLLTAVKAGGTAALTLDAAATIGATEIPELVYKLPDPYQKGSTVAWVMKRATEGLIRGLQGDPFLFNPNPAGSDRNQPEIWGYPVYNSEYASAVEASAKSLIFGDWSYVYMRESTQFGFLRDPYTLAAKGQVRMLYFFRTVYKVAQAEALVYATHPTA